MTAQPDPLATGDRVAVVASSRQFGGRAGTVVFKYPSGLLEVRLDGGDNIECGGEYLCPLTDQEARRPARPIR